MSQEEVSPELSLGENAPGRVDEREGAEEAVTFVEREVRNGEQGELDNAAADYLAISVGKQGIVKFATSGLCSGCGREKAVSTDSDGEAGREVKWALS